MFFRHNIFVMFTAGGQVLHALAAVADAAATANPAPLHALDAKAARLNHKRCPPPHVSFVVIFGMERPALPGKQTGVRTLHAP